MSRHSWIIACIAAAFVLAACGGRSTTLPDTAADEGAFGVPSSSGVATRGLEDERRGEAEREAALQRLLDNLVVYFEFDRSEIRGDFNEMLTAHAEYLASNARAHVRLEGHTDERGSREYNIGLGERRAQAVRRFLMLQGVSAEQVSTVSYGEERPAALGSDEEAWSLNRRVELVYR